MNILEMQILRAKVFNKIIVLRNPNTTRFKGDTSHINGQLTAYSEVLSILDESIKDKKESCKI